MPNNFSFSTQKNIPVFTYNILTTTTATTMPLLSVSHGTVKELFRGSAQFARPSTKKGAGWVATGDKGNAIIQQHVNQDGTTVLVVRWTNFMGADGMNGRILIGLPIQRNGRAVYFKTSSTTTLGNRYKAPFCFKFETVDAAEDFEMWWLSKNGSIASWKANDANKKEGSNRNLNIRKNMPLQEVTNALSAPALKRKAVPMIDGPLRKRVKDDDLKSTAKRSIGLMPSEVNINGKVRKIVKVKRSTLKSITEDPIDGLNVVDDDNSNDLNDNIDSSNDSSDEVGEDVIIDEEDAPQSQNWMTAFASYD